MGLSELDESSLILVAAPSIGPAESEVCTQLLSMDVDHPHVLHIDFIKSPRERITHWTDHAPTRPNRLGM